MKKLKCIIDKNCDDNLKNKAVLDNDGNKIGNILKYNKETGEVILQVSDKSYKKYIKNTLEFYT
jgi:hypothetical protein